MSSARPQATVSSPTENDDTAITVDPAARELPELDEKTPASDERCLISRKHRYLTGTAVEITTFLAYSTAIYPFLPEDLAWYGNPFIPAAAMSAVALLSSNTQYINELLFEDSHPESKWLKFLSLAHAFMFAVYDVMTRGILMHEGGHAITSLPLSNNQNPKITIYPLYQVLSSLFSSGIVLPGITQLNLKNISLTSLGEYFGKENSLIMIHAAGSVSEYLYCLAALLAAQLMSNKFPQVSMHLRVSTIFNMICVGNYVLTPYYKDCTKNISDFCKVQEKGVSPLAILSVLYGTMALFQLILSLGAKFSESCRKKSNPNPAEVPGSLFHRLCVSCTTRAEAQHSIELESLSKSYK